MASELDALFFDLHAFVKSDYGSRMEGARPRATEVGAVPVPTVASKVAFPDSLNGFNPLPFLNPSMAQAYHNPRDLLRDSGEDIRILMCLACRRMQYLPKRVSSLSL